MPLDFPKEFRAKMAHHKPDFYVRGLLTRTGMIYPLGTDTKVLSTVFELIVRPFVYEIASEHGLIVFESPMQNFYPDFTLMKNQKDSKKLAVDVKTTYRNYVNLSRDRWRAGFTLGSYTSFIRNETKNIAFPYSQYTKHYIVGFVYTRAINADVKHFYALEDEDEIPCPMADVDFFVQEKHRIAGERAGSGNTTNIGSIVGTSIDDFAKGRGPFAGLGEQVFLDYWRNYGRTGDTRPYRNLKEYFAWREPDTPRKRQKR